MLKLFDGKIDDFPFVRWFFACPSLSRNAVDYSKDEMSRIIFREDILPDHEPNTPENFLSWWRKNVVETSEFSVDKMQYLSKLLIGLWSMDTKNMCDIEQECSLGSNILKTDKLLRDAEITFSFGRRKNPKSYENPNIVQADDIFEKMGISYLSKKQNDVLISQEKFLWINGPAGSGKTVLILGKVIQTVQDGHTKAVIFTNII